MKHIFAVPGLLLLAACSSTGGAYTIGQNVDTIGASNARVTSMRTSVDNRLAVIEYAQSVGVVPAPKTEAVASNLNPSRVGHTGPAYNREPNVRDQEQEKIGEYYAMAQTAFQNMYNIYKNGLDGMTDSAIKNAYLIAGGTEWSDDLTDNQITEFIAAQIESTQYQENVLDKYFNSGSEPDTWIFEPKTESINDVPFKLVSNDDVLKFTLGDSGKIMQISLGDQNYIRKGDKSNAFWYKDATTGDETTVAIAKPDINLKYSDFGRIVKTVRHIDADGKITSSDVYQNVFAGGYDLKNIDRSTVASVVGDTSMDFKGTAIGIIRGQNDRLMQVSGDATLNFMDGTETIDLMFANDSKSRNWYNVHIVDTGSTQRILFKDDPTVEADFQLSETGTNIDFDGMNINYYGDRNSPTEFVGTATYSDSGNGVSMDAAFGGNLVKPTGNP